MNAPAPAVIVDVDRETLVIERPRPDGSVERVRVVRWEVLARWRRRATFAFVVLGFVATVAAFLAEQSGRESERSLRGEGRRAVTQSCLDRMEVRVTVAVAFDELRRMAFGDPRTERQRQAREEFLMRTQAPIDRLLTEAAGQTVKTAGELLPEDVGRVQALGTARCEAVGKRFEHGALSSD